MRLTKLKWKVFYLITSYVISLFNEQRVYAANNLIKIFPSRSSEVHEKFFVCSKLLVWHQQAHGWAKHNKARKKTFHPYDRSYYIKVLERNIIYKATSVCASFSYVATWEEAESLFFPLLPKEENEEKTCYVKRQIFPEFYTWCTCMHTTSIKKKMKKNENALHNFMQDLRYAWFQDAREDEGKLCDPSQELLSGDSAEYLHRSIVSDTRSELKWKAEHEKCDTYVCFLPVASRTSRRRKLILLCFTIMKY